MPSSFLTAAMVPWDNEGFYTSQRRLYEYRSDEALLVPVGTIIVESYRISVSQLELAIHLLSILTIGLPFSLNLCSSSSHNIPL